MYWHGKSVQRELHKRRFKRSKHECIEIPFPTRTVHVKEPASKKAKN